MTVTPAYFKQMTCMTCTHCLAKLCLQRSNLHYYLWSSNLDRQSRCWQKIIRQMTQQIC